MFVWRGEEAGGEGSNEKRKIYAQKIKKRVA
jgi:hypothetical protein